MALLMSRKLGVLVKSTTKSSDSLKKDIKRIVSDNFISTSLSIKMQYLTLKLQPNLKGVLFRWASK